MGVQTNQFPRAVELARQFRAAGIDVIMGGFHTSGTINMLGEKRQKSCLKEGIMTPKKVLVVDDYRDLLVFLGKVLAVLGWDAILAATAREALSKLEYGLPSVILLDMRMAGMDGFEVAGILKNHPVYSKIPILAASAYPSDLARARSLTAGCDDFISKPFAISALQARLTRLASTASQRVAEATRP